MWRGVLSRDTILCVPSRDAILCGVMQSAAKSFSPHVTVGQLDRKLDIPAPLSPSNQPFLRTHSGQT
jgi:hypothetical protein